MKGAEPGTCSAVQGRSSLQQWIRRAAGLALLPHNEVQDARVEAMDSTPNVPRAQEFNDYMNVNWIYYDVRLPCRSETTMRPMGHAPTTILKDSITVTTKQCPHYHPNIYRFVGDKTRQDFIYTRAVTQRRRRHIYKIFI